MRHANLCVSVSDDRIKTIIKRGAMNSIEAINQNFIPYPYTFPSITFVVEHDHECEKLSMCCGAEPSEYVDYFCSGCNEGTTFECNECEEINND